MRATSSAPHPSPKAPCFARRTLLPRACLRWSGSSPGEGGLGNRRLFQFPSPPRGGRGQGEGGIALRCCLWVVMLVFASTLPAQTMGPPPSGLVAANQKPAMLQGIGIDQRLNAQLPLALRFRDEAGRAVSLGDYFGKRPVILALVYYNCPMLCTPGPERPGRIAEHDVARRPDRDFDVVAVSFDPRETPEDARAKKEAYLSRYKRPAQAAGWHFLTGDEADIHALDAGRRIPLSLRRDPAASTRTRAAIFVATPDGRLARYFYGIEYPAARPAPRAGRGVRGPDRHARGPDPPLLLPLRPDDRQVRRGDREPDPARRALLTAGLARRVDLGSCARGKRARSCTERGADAAPARGRPRASRDTSTRSTSS